LLNIKTQSIEFSLVEKEVFAGLKQGNSILKEIHNETPLEKVEKLMEDTADAIAYQNVNYVIDLLFVCWFIQQEN
jgi:charged multivesicular body protein 6